MQTANLNENRGPLNYQTQPFPFLWLDKRYTTSYFWQHVRSSDFWWQIRLIDYCISLWLIQIVLNSPQIQIQKQSIIFQYQPTDATECESIDHKLDLGKRKKSFQKYNYTNNIKKYVAAAMEQWATAFAPQAECWVFESQPRQI